MRTFTAAALLVSLAACDGGGVIDQSIEQGVRQTAIQTCIAWVPQSDIPAAAALQAERLCACATDRMLDGKSLSELSTIGSTVLKSERRSCNVSQIAKLSLQNPPGEAPRQVHCKKVPSHISVGNRIARGRGPFRKTGPQHRQLPGRNGGLGPPVRPVCS
jgi:hypothetical protein